jgi:hypothetical protein
MLFYAIAWGTAANSQPRWKAFAYAHIFGPQGQRALFRVLLSWLLLNLAAVCTLATPMRSSDIETLDTRREDS